MPQLWTSCAILRSLTLFCIFQSCDVFIVFEEFWCSNFLAPLWACAGPWNHFHKDISYGWKDKYVEIHELILWTFHAVKCMLEIDWSHLHFSGEFDFVSPSGKLKLFGSFLERHVWMCRMDMAASSSGSHSGWWPEVPSGFVFLEPWSPGNLELMQVSIHLLSI